MEFDSKWIFIISSPFHLQAKFVKVAKQGRARMQFSIDSYDSRDRKEMPYHLKLTSRPDSALSFTSDVEETASLNLDSEPRIAKELRTEVPMLAPSEKEQAQTQPPPPPAVPPKAQATTAEAVNFEVIEQQQMPPLPPRKESLQESQREQRGPSPKPSLPARPSEAVRKAAAASGKSLRTNQRLWSITVLNTHLWFCHFCTQVVWFFE